MSKCGFALTATLAALWISASVPAANAASQTWRVDDATVTLSLDAAHLSTLGLTIAGDRTTATTTLGVGELIEGERHSYRLASGVDLTFRTDNGAFADFAGSQSTASLPFDGGLAFRTTHPRTGEALAPAFLYDFALEIDPAAELDLVRLVSPDPAFSAPLKVRSSSIAFTWDTGELAIMRGDLVVTREWAELLGQPGLANQWVGGFDLRVQANPVDGQALAPSSSDLTSRGGGLIDVTLGQLYGLTSQGRTGSYPNGMNGLSAATTSCNSGDVNVPWFAAMDEEHPTIGLAMFRESSDGVLEQIGRNYLKHGWYALSNNQCNFGCQGSAGGVYLVVGCSDTYSAGNNGNRHDLGPRHEVNPVTGAWVACGSLFDDGYGSDGDCQRDYFGSEPNNVNHRIEVHDSDLGNSGATYYYEGEYVVTGDSDLQNSIGWRQVNTSWSGSSWQLNTVGGGVTPVYGPLVQTWGDEQVSVSMPDHDGVVIVATQVTDLGGGQWHYEYAVYNWWSRRGVRSFSVPLGAATISNVGFHDIDQDSGNDWTVDTSGGSITWSTDDYATDPDANAVFFQMLYNFRFDANVAPEPGTTTLEAFLPGSGSTAFANVQVPQAGATSVLGSAPLEELQLVTEPNPFSQRTEVRFALSQDRNVRLAVVDVTGRIVRTLVDGPVPGGSHGVDWDGRNDSGQRLASGVYFFRLDAGDQSRTVKATLLR